MRRGSCAASARESYVLILRPEPGIDGIRALRAALKYLLRRFGLRVVKISEVRNQCRNWG
jgi:hypothetical protein